MVGLILLSFLLSLAYEVYSFRIFNKANCVPSRCVQIYASNGDEPKQANKIISENRKANFEYEMEETITAGIVLVGSEVKSCRKSGVSISDGIAEIVDGELWLLNVHISEHSRCGMREQHAPKRKRKLLITKKELLKLEQRILQRNYEIVPMRMFFSEKSFVKVLLGIGKQKSLNDKRDDIIKKEGDREVRRVMKGGYD